MRIPPSTAAQGVTVTFAVTAGLALGGITLETSWRLAVLAAIAAAVVTLTRVRFAVPSAVLLLLAVAAAVQIWL